MQSNFEIKLVDTYWLEDLDESLDRCLHGTVQFILDGTLIYESARNRTVSVTGYYLLKAIDTNYTPNQYGSQILPCCGFTMFADLAKGDVCIIGCPEGDEFSISHSSEWTRLIFPGHEPVRIQHKAFKSSVLEFIDTIELIYSQSKPKCIPVDNFDKEAYEYFWKDWSRMKLQHFEQACSYKNLWSGTKCQTKTKLEIKRQSLNEIRK